MFLLRMSKNAIKISDFRKLRQGIFKILNAEKNI